MKLPQGGERTERGQWRSHAFSQFPIRVGSSKQRKTVGTMAMARFASPLDGKPNGCPDAED